MPRWLVWALIVGVMALPSQSWGVAGVADVVFDPTNFAKNALTAFQTAKSNVNEAVFIYNQGQQLLRQAQQIQNQLKNLKSLPPGQMFQELSGLLNSSTSILGQAQGISFELQKASADYLLRYGPNAAGSGMAQGLYDMSKGWTNQLRDAAKTAFSASAKLAQLRTSNVQLGSASSYSDSAVGALEALQAGNRVSVIHAEQTAVLIELQAAAARQQASYYALQAAAEEAGRARMEEWLARNRDAIPVFVEPGQTTGGLPLMRLR